MAVGYAARRSGLLSSDSARRIMITVQKFLTPGVLFLSFWGLESLKVEFVFLPLTGAAVIAFQLALAAWAAPRLGLGGPSRGAFLVAAVLSNIGYLGWFVNLALFGKRGFDYAFLYGFYFQFAVYLVAYPIAARHGGDAALKSLGFWKRLFVEGILAVALTAIGAGLGLNVCGVRVPAPLKHFHPVLIQTATSVLMFAAGLTIRIRSFRKHLKPGLAICALKLIVTPVAVAAVLAVLTPWLRIDPLLGRVVTVESMMPSAIACLTLASIFHLDQDLMNAMWLLSTLLFFPALQLVLMLLL